MNTLKRHLALIFACLCWVTALIVVNTPAAAAPTPAAAEPVAAICSPTCPVRIYHSCDSDENLRVMATNGQVHTVNICTNREGNFRKLWVEAGCNVIINGWGGGQATLHNDSTWYTIARWGPGGGTGSTRQYC